MPGLAPCCFVQTFQKILVTFWLLDALTDENQREEAGS